MTEQDGTYAQEKTSFCAEINGAPAHEDKSFREMFFQELKEKGSPEIAKFVVGHVAKIYPAEALDILSASKSPQAPEFIEDIFQANDGLALEALDALKNLQNFWKSQKVDALAASENRPEGAAYAIIQTLIQVPEYEAEKIGSALDTVIEIFRNAEDISEKSPSVAACCMTSMFEGLKGHDSLREKVMKSLVEEVSANEKAMRKLVNFGRKLPDDVLPALEGIDSEVVPGIIAEIGKVAAPGEEINGGDMQVARMITAVASLKKIWEKSAGGGLKNIKTDAIKLAFERVGATFVSVDDPQNLDKVTEITREYGEQYNALSDLFVSLAEQQAADPEDEVLSRIIRNIMEKQAALEQDYHNNLKQAGAKIIRFPDYN